MADSSTSTTSTTAPSTAPETSETPSGSGGSTSRWKIAGYVVAGLAGAALLWWLGQQGGQYIPRFAEWVDRQGAWGPVLFIVGYAVATVAFLPGAALTLASGAVFGLWQGLLYAFTGAFIGSAAAFLIARYVARGWVEKKLEGKPRFAQIDRAIGKDGGKIVALLRLSPVFPFNLLNYALGLTNVRFLHYVLASFAMIPGTLLYVYYGKVAGDVAAATSGATEKTVWDWVLLVAGLVATIIVTWIITKKAKKALDAEVPGDLEASAEDE